ncbi:MAG TPA: ATP-binding protein [Candidatus Omnitrophota bacterium]|nr:ATP-binding protein [Candidatus Omnitrophota bacterium]
MIDLLKIFNFNSLLTPAVSIYLPVATLALISFLAALLSWRVYKRIKAFKKRIAKLEHEISQKAVEISKVIEELRAIQLKLFETGKISAVASLSAGILHQISQPITAIHGFVKFIKKEMNKEDTFYKPICLMEEQSQYMKEMLEDLMELIRHREIRKENIDVNACIKRALNLLTDELRIRRVNWDLFLGDNLPLVYADSVHLQQVFMNVVINAIQALSLLPRGSTRYIKITSELNKNKDQVVLSFQDTGPGLSVEDQKQIFEPFFSTKTTGTGIGLALCKDLIAEHEGTVDVISLPGQGATFMITLPCASMVTKEQ